MGNEMNRQSARSLSTDLGRGVAAGLLLAALGSAAPAGAVDFASGEVSGSWDTTASIGEAWRVNKPDSALIGTADGGTGRSPNVDSGDANYRAGQPVSLVGKLTSELSVKYRNFGVFARGALLYDKQVMEGQTDRTPISKAAQDVAGSYVRLLDAFVYGKFELGAGHPLELRVGKQILSWGESTFIQGGLTAVNAIDIAALRAPGSEIKEGFLPQDMVHATLGLSEHVNLEGFYMFDWRPTILEPVGTYFSANNYVPAGGDTVFLGFGKYSNQGTDFRPLGGPFIANFQGVPRGPDVMPSKSGQYGVALRWFAPGLGNGTEFGFYFMNYASRVPVLSGRTGTAAGLANAGAAATAVVAAAQALVGAGTPASAVLAGVGAGLQASAANGGNISAATLASYATIAVNTYLGGGSVAGQANALATHEFSETAQYFAEYPDKLQSFGVSFNTQLGKSGLALQGELVYRKNTPLQYDDVELLFAALTPLEQALFPLSAPGVPFPTSCLAALPTLSRCGQLGAYAPGQVVTGWGRYDVWQFQTTATKAFPPMLGAQQVVLVAEIGVTDVPSLPSKTSGGPNGQGLRLNGPGTDVSGNVPLAYLHFGEVEPLDRFASSVSWGYRLAARLDYPGLVGPWNVTPRVTWQHDVSGTTPGPAGNFVEGRHALGLGVTASLQSRWELDLSYSRYGGAGRWNELNDRDYVAAVVKLSF